VIGIVAIEGALHPGRLPLTDEDSSRARMIAARYRATFDEVAIAADDQVSLRAWSMRPSGWNGREIVLLHGQADNRAGMLGTAEMLLQNGYAVLLPDARGHGDSGGQIATYGVKEAGDVRRWFDWVKGSHRPTCIDGLGDSMGAAQLLGSLAAEPEFCAVVAESAFGTFEEAAYDRLGQQFRTGPWLGRTLLRPAVEAGLLYARMKYGVDLKQANPRRAVSGSRVPILLIHGGADTNLPPRHSEMIKSGNAAVVLWEPPGAGHCGAAGAAPVEYQRRVVGWFASHQSGRTVAASY
jgi:pimeloyl-ACP methyl ester carboxylesterase